MARRRQARCTLWAGGELIAVGQRESAGAASWALKGQLECGRALNAAALYDERHLCGSWVLHVRERDAPGELWICLGAGGEA